MSIIDKVFDFNEQVIKIPSDHPLQPLDDASKDWLLKAISEEMIEYQSAHREQDLVAQIDAMVDLIYFAVGSLKRMGLTREQAKACFNAVHEANMTKKRGVKGTRGDFEADAIKPEGWKSPETRIGEVLFGDQ